MGDYIEILLTIAIVFQQSGAIPVQGIVSFLVIILDNSTAYLTRDVQQQGKTVSEVECIKGG